MYLGRLADSVTNIRNRKPVRMGLRQEIIHDYRHAAPYYFLPYFYPPFQIVAYLPLTVMPLRWAYRLWMIITVALIAFGSYFRPASRAGRQIMQIGVVFMAATLALLLHEISLIKRDKRV